MHKRTGMTVALAISLLLHASIVALLSVRQPEQSRLQPEMVVEVRLKHVTPRVADKPAPAAPEPAHDSTSRPHRKSEQQAASVPQPAVRDWRQEIGDVARAQFDSTQSRYVAPPARNPGIGQAADSRIPELAAAFRSPPGKICGKEVEFEVGMHKFTMPVSYACDDKQSEYREAPVRQQLIEESADFSEY